MLDHLNLAGINLLGLRWRLILLHAVLGVPAIFQLHRVGVTCVSDYRVLIELRLVGDDDLFFL